MQLTEDVRIYQDTNSTLADGDSVPDAVTLISPSTMMNIQRGTREAQQMAFGISNNPPAIGFGDVDDEALYATRNVIVDEEGVGWIIRGTPSVRKRFSATNHVKVLLIALTILPDGIN